MRETLETMKRVPRQGHLFDISFSGGNQSFSLTALKVTIIGRIGVTAEVQEP